MTSYAIYGVYIWKRHKKEDDIMLMEAGIKVNQGVLKLLIVFGNADNGEKRQKEGARP